MDDIDYITVHELRDRLLHDALCEKTVVIDVRGYDRVGGHIAGSRSVPTGIFPLELRILVSELAYRSVLIVFHCMYSQQRGPSAAALFISELPDDACCRVAVLEGGFAAWASTFGADPDPRLLADFDSEPWEE